MWVVDLVNSMLKVVMVIIGVFGSEMVLVLLGVSGGDWVVVVGGYLLWVG